MGLDYYIGDKQIRITNYYWFNEFLNLIAQLGDFPQILDHSPAHGEYRIGYSGSSLFVGSVESLKMELEELQSMKLPEFVVDIVASMLEGCELAIRNKTKITLDNGAYLSD